MQTRRRHRMLAAILLAGGAFRASLIFTSTEASTSATTTAALPAIPKFRGLTLDEARALARRRGGRVYVALQIPSSAPVDAVLSQSPNATWPVGLVISMVPCETTSKCCPVSVRHRHECAETVWLTEDGNVYPLLCSGQRINVGAWLFYARNRPSMMSLARTASLARVASSLCHYKVGTPKGFNRTAETLLEQENVFILAVAYNGWRIPHGLNCANSALSP